VGGAILSSVLLIAELAVTNGDPNVTLIFPIPALVGMFESEAGWLIGMQSLSAMVAIGVLIFAAVKDRRFVDARELAARDLLAAELPATPTQQAAVQSDRGENTESENSQD
ncbi:MAG: hypothetical protein ACR2RV_26000, partial [Verrucomicrobiales bacterium]